MTKLSDPIPIGRRFPRKRSTFIQHLAHTGLILSRWRITGCIPDVAKVVLIGGPHTSNWDFVFGALSIFRLGLNIHWIGKHTIFRWPFSAFLRSFGGIPVNRGNPGALYRDILHGFEENNAYAFGLSPEGTRAKVDQWKPGFHRIAVAAGVPILPVSIDFKKREIEFGPMFYPSGDFAADVISLQSYYAQFAAKRPAQS